MYPLLDLNVHYYFFLYHRSWKLYSMHVCPQVVATALLPVLGCKYFAVSCSIHHFYKANRRWCAFVLYSGQCVHFFSIYLTEYYLLFDRCEFS